MIERILSWRSDDCLLTCKIVKLVGNFLLTYTSDHLQVDLKVKLLFILLSDPHKSDGRENV